RTDVALSDGNVVEAAAIECARISGVVSEACIQGYIFIYGRFICTNGVGSISSEGGWISGLITCVTLHQVKIELSIGNGGTGGNRSEERREGKECSGLVVWAGVKVESGTFNTNIRIDVHESV